MASTSTDSAAAVSSKLSPEERFELVTRNLGEVLNAQKIKDDLAKPDYVPKLYWGTAPTGRPHIGYFVPLTKIADFLTAGIEVIVLLADVHAFLDNMKAPLETVTQRTLYYKYLLLSVFRSIGVPTDRLKFVVGSSYQYSQQYTLDKFRACAMTTEHDARRAGAEVVKQVESPLLSGLIYPLMQALDEEHLGVDMQFGGIDQRKIFILAESLLPKLGYAKRAHLMNEMVPGLAGSKMSSSDPNSKIDLLDPPEAIKKKVKQAFAEPGVVEGNGLLAFVKAVLMPLNELKRLAKGARVAEGVEDPQAPDGTVFEIRTKGPSKDAPGQTKWYADADVLEADYASQAVHPGDLKPAVTEALIRLLAPIRAEYEADKDWQEIDRLAYAPPKTEAEKAGDKKKAKKEEKAARRAKEKAEVSVADGVVPDPPKVEDVQKELEKTHLSKP